VNDDATDDTTGWLEAIEAHMTALVGPAPSVHRELTADGVHVDIRAAAAGGARDFHLLYTLGVSARPMRVPDGVDSTPYIELAVLLPSSWPLTPDAWSHERWYWPVRGLGYLAGLPHRNQSWLGALHTIANGSPPKPFAPDTALCGFVLLPWMTFEPEAALIAMPGGRTVEVLTLVPLHGDELELKLRRGPQALFDRLTAADVDDVIDPARPSVAAATPRGARR
jgi:hypothetical protein